MHGVGDAAGLATTSWWHIVGLPLLAWLLYELSSYLGWVMTRAFFTLAIGHRFAVRPCSTDFIPSIVDI